MSHLNIIDKSWTLFLDRDGVINEEKNDDYINTWDEFKFYDGAVEAIKIFSEKFGRVFIVTNQRGIAKGITKLHDLDHIHNNLLKEVKEAKGHIDKIYYCGDLENSSPNRKPNPGMGLQAKRDYPEIDFSKSIMIGNTLSDMEFGKNIGVALNIFLPTTRKDVIPNPIIDLIFRDLISVARAL
jgi:D-glycero-D-manno-heptose 1,7-bisphosphate phosphatase